MEDEKNLHELPDELIESVSGGAYEKEFQSIDTYVTWLEKQYNRGMISTEKYDYCNKQLRAYRRYICELIHRNEYNEEILFDENIDWIWVARLKGISLK